MNSLRERLGIVIPVIVLMTICFGQFFAPNDPFEVDMLSRFQAPSNIYPLGTDLLGRCTFSRLLYGGRTTIGIVLFGAVLVLLVGTITGLFMSGANRKQDIVFESLLNSITAIPPIAFLVIFIAAWGNGVVTMVTAITLSLFLRLIKLVKTRAEIELKKAYVICAVTSGAGKVRLLFCHILPNVLPDIIEYICLSCADMTLAIVGFSFIGLGLSDNVIDWGTMVAEAQQLLLIEPHLTMYPIACIFVSTLCFHMLGRNVSKREAQIARH